ncbi:hypothetical protein [Microbispora sp. NPDC049125]|uniref:hypothetical protein n=1 Tax=Microbispora sp. NPDC049125 TaxID=3154929 RepID=UPI003466FBD2
MHPRAHLVIATTLTGAALVAGVPAPAQATPLGQSLAELSARLPASPGRQVIGLPPDATPAPAPSEKTPAPEAPAPKTPSLPSGTATATSFWDAQTASGHAMSYATIASPYWPLGTKVKITYRGKSANGVVQDFGPAEWAVAQHDIPAIVDLSEEMMADLSGVRSNTVHVRFQVIKWGSGPVYRHSGTGYGLAMGRG